MRTLGRQKWYILGGVAVLALALVAIAINALTPKATSPSPSTAVVENSESDKNTPSSPDTSTKPTGSTQPAAALDPATVGTIDIQPLSLTVSYVKGIEGFEYTVKRSSGGTQYVEFMSPQLVGTKCTDDTGTFASIIESPDTNEASTITATQTVDGTKYGLSLSDTTCTGNEELLKQYQASFRDAFSLLKKTS